MNRILTLVIIVCFSGTSLAQTLVNVTSPDSSIGTPTSYYSYIKGIQLSDGGFVLLDNSYLSGVQSDGYVLMKLDQYGNIVGTLNYNSLFPGNNYGTNLYTKGNYVYVTGFTIDSTGTNSVTFNTTKISLSSFDTTWTRSENIDSGTEEIPVSILADDQGNVYLGGTVQTTSANMMAVVKYDSMGNRLWVSNYDTVGMYTSAVAMALNYSASVLAVTGFRFDGNGHSDFITADVTTSTGNIYGYKTTSNSTGAISHPVNVAVDQYSNTYVGGTSTVSGNASVIKVVSYDTGFNQLWTATWGDSTLTNIASSMTLDLMGLGYNIFITGSTINSSGQHSLVVLRYTTDGTLQWAKTITAPNPAYPTDGISITTDGNGNSFIAGSQYNGTDTSVYTLGLDSLSNVGWTNVYNRAPGTNDVPYSIIYGGSSGMFVTTRSFGSDSLYMLLSYNLWSPAPCGDTTCPTITYALENGHVSFSGTDTFEEFDIYAMQNIGGLGYAGGDIIFTYNQNVFGNSVVDSGHITITRGAIISDTNYVITATDTLFTSDAVKSNDGEVSLLITPQNSSGLYFMPDTLIQLCHVKMKVKHKNNYAIGFDQFFMEDNSYYFNGDYEAYTLVNTMGSLRSVGDSIITFQISLDSFIYPNSWNQYEWESVVFDIQAYTSGYDYLYAADPIIDFNIGAFGSFVNANNVVTCTSISDSTGSAYDFSVTDAYSAAFQVHLDADPGNFDIVNNPSLVIATSPFSYTTIATCTMTLQNCCADLIDLSINPASTGTYAYIDTNNLPQSASYPIVVTGPGYDTTGDLCITSTSLPVITGFSPEYIAAGTFDTLTINGHNFGCSVGTVQFTCVQGGFVTAQPLDIISWNNDQIQLIVASCQNSYFDNFVPGTGPIQIILASNNQPVESSAILTIPYAVLNDRLPSGRAIRVGLSGADSGAFGGLLHANEYTFIPDTTVTGHTPSLQTITHAMNDWVCETGVRFTMGNPVSYNLTANDTDFTNSIFFGDLSGSSDLYGRCIVAASGPCPTSTGDTVEVILDEDYIFDQTALAQLINYPWFLGDTSAIPDTIPGSGVKGYISLLSIARHEFGHGHGLRHTLNMSDLMYPGFGADTCKLIHLDDQQGGLYELVNVAAYLDSGHCFSPNPRFGYRGLPACSGGDAGISDIRNVYSINVYPNPFDQSIILSADISAPSEVKIEIISILGQSIIYNDYGIVLNSQFQKTIKTPDLSAGVYLLRVSINNTANIFKLIKN